MQFNKYVDPKEVENYYKCIYLLKFRGMSPLQEPLNHDT